MKDITFIKNVASEIKEYFEELNNIHYPSYPSIDRQRVRDILGNENRLGDENDEFSWYSDNVKPQGCGYWHVDYGGNHDMVMVSWDSPTKILIDDDKVVLNTLGQSTIDSCHIEDNHNKIEEIIEKNNLTVFTPNKGDIYYFKPNVIHMTNPDAIGKPRLVLRIYDPLFVPVGE